MRFQDPPNHVVKTHRSDFQKLESQLAVGQTPTLGTFFGDENKHPMVLSFQSKFFGGLYQGSDK